MQTIVSAIFGEGFSPLGGMGPPKGEETALPTTLSGLGSANSSCPLSLLNLHEWGVLCGRGFEEAILVQTTQDLELLMGF